MDRPEINKSKTPFEPKAIPISLPVKIAGLVFWGLVLIGFVLVVLAINWLEKDLIRHNDSIDNQTFILTREIFEQAPNASKNNIQRALNKILQSTGAAGLTVSSEKYGKFTSGSITGDYKKKTIYFAITLPPKFNAATENFKLRIYQTPIDKIINTQKKQLMTFMVLLFFVFGMLLQWILKKLLNQPIQQMVHTAKLFSEGKDVRFDEEKNDEFGYLSKFINKALDSLRERQQELTHQASHDKLTGLYNRHEFDIRLNQFLNLAKTENLYSSLCYMDLDQFKIINDTCGHIAGDELLKQISSKLKSMLRDSDFIARLGGDEFGVLLQGCMEEDAIRISKKLLNAVKNFQFSWEGKSFPIGVSIGIALITPETKSAIEILSLADVACYTAKDKGRNQIHVYEPHHKELKRKRGEMMWVSQIREALKNDSFILYQQRIMPIEDKKNIKNHYEILIRIIDDGDNLILPSTFIGSAELYGLMTDIDYWVVKNTFIWMNKNISTMNNISQLSINISGQSITSKIFLHDVISFLVKYAIPPDKVCFEITETSAIANYKSAINFINVLKNIGCKFSLDDFGSGMSSFAYLKNLNIDYLKIDGSYVHNIVNDPIDKAMVEAVNQIGHAMGLETIAEFVEDQEIFKVLKVIGVDYAQGYGIAKPAPLNNLI